MDDVTILVIADAAAVTVIETPSRVAEVEVAVVTTIASLGAVVNDDAADGVDRPKLFFSAKKVLKRVTCARWVRLTRDTHAVDCER